jgi:hypothetical protein
LAAYRFYGLLPRIFTQSCDVRVRLDELPGRTCRILQQRPKDKNHLYALHALEVECISKGKPRVRYEFGVKVSIITVLKALSAMP